MKIAVLGYSGSGKSILSKHLGNVYDIPVLYLDKVQFLHRWQQRDGAKGLRPISEFMEKPSWVIDDNYRKYLQRERLKASERIIMHFNRISCLFRAFKR